MARTSALITKRTVGKAMPWKFLLRLAISAAILIVVLLGVELSEVAAALQEVRLPAYAVSLAVAICGALIISLKYYLMAESTGVHAPFHRVVAINFIARFYGLLVPSGAGQGAVRWYKMTKDRNGKAYFLAASVFERLLFLTTALAFVVVLLYSLPLPEPVIELRDRLAPVFAAVGALLLAGFAYFFVPGANRRLRAFFARLPLLKKQRILDGLERLTISQLSGGRIALLALLSVAWQVVYIGRVSLLFVAVGEPMAFLQVAWIASLVFLLQVLPVSVAGLGVREGAYVYIFSLYALPENLGFLLGMLFFTHMLVFAAIGGILNVTEDIPNTRG